MSPVILTESDVRGVLAMPELIEAMEAALVAYSTGRAQQPVRTVLEVGPDKAFFGVMPASLPELPALGAKLVTVFEGNAARGLPTHLATILLLDPQTGALLAQVDGRFITEVRTAAVSAVATRLLAVPHASTLGIIGSGVQAGSHLDALRCVRPLARVRVWSPSIERRERFAAEAAGRSGLDVEVCGSAEAAVRDAELVVLATSARTPVVRNRWIADGTHICAVGACRPDQQEMEPAILGRARVFVDSRTGALAESGDIRAAIAQGLLDGDAIAGEIGALAAGRLTGRQRPDQVTVFKSLGMAVEDVAAAYLAYSRAMARRRLGTGGLG
ncbi:MAG TPA: ornithine cyclodeaminase family protein [Vicinamibacterales bacterium]|nr:ornithine cyclodeaminase family protein [Vicinamibacterales bacterium]